MRKRLLFASLLTVISCVTSACSQSVETPTVVVDSESANVSFTLIPTQYADVVLTKRLDAIAVQSKEQEVSFNATGKYIDKVYVRKGDIVKKGDLLCELSSSQLETEIQDLEYSVKRNELQLEYSKKNEELDIQRQWVNAMSPYSFASQRDVEKSVDELKERYERERTLINDALEFDREELEKKKTELKNSRLYATMDGTVYKIKDHLQGSTTKADDVIMTIIDSSECFFSVDGTECKDMFHEGDRIDMNVSYSSSSGDYIITPYDIDNWNEKMIFSVISQPDTANVEVGTYGSITIPIDSREHVLSIPKNILHNVEDKYFVYTLSEENVREIRYIEIGLIGDDRVEIISGLTEGEKVVKK